jgi:hypothetical protein
VLVSKLTCSSGKEGASLTGLVHGDVEEVGIIEPNAGSLGAEFLNHGFEQAIGILV